MRSFIGYLVISQLRDMEKHNDRPVAEMPLFLVEGAEQQIFKQPRPPFLAPQSPLHSCPPSHAGSRPYAGPAKGVAF